MQLAALAVDIAQLLATQTMGASIARTAYLVSKSATLALTAGRRFQVEASADAGHVSPDFPYTVRRRCARHPLKVNGQKTSGTPSCNNSLRRRQRAQS